MELYGLIGKKLSHSFSPAYFTAKFKQLSINAEYRLFEIESASQLPEIIQSNPDLKGLNVTIPYKNDVLAFLDWVDEPAKKIGAVNTIKVERGIEGVKLTGYNTDIIGFKRAISLFIKNPEGKRALILGTGGSAKAVAFVLDQLKTSYKFVSRHPLAISEMSYDVLSERIVKYNQLIINTTPVGMYPNIGNAPNIPYQFLDEDHYLFDLVYNPNETSFLKNGKENGAKVTNGLKMLEIQADESWNIWRAG